MIEEQARGFRGSFSGYERDRLFYRPEGGGRFVQAAYVFGLDDDHDGRAAAPVDIDGDGDLDLALLTLRGLKLLENTSAPRRFSRVRLVPRGSPAAALGAEVTLRAGGTARRDFVRLTEGFRAQVPLDLHFGLGDATTIAELEVRWPSGETDAWRDLPVDRLLVVDQDAGTVADELLKRWSDGSRPTVTGSPSPAVLAQVLDGGRAPLAGGRPAVINFWAPWCAPCNVELPQLVELAGRYAGEVDFAGISVELDDLDSVRESIDRFGIPYPQFLADEALMERFFGSEDEAALPATFVFDQEGRLRRLFRGAVTDAELDALLASFRDEAVSEDTLRLLAETYRQAGDYARAAEFYGQRGALEPPRLDQIGQAWQRQRALDWIAKARAHRALGELVEARESYDRALQMEPGNRTARSEREALGAR
ncbi:MAG: ASPIC/UnbV domain-containing protein [Acidobacteria bacterium]|nr:ASPIC/UnbV domain-containing protein [Acidobacteriota bacterium]